jgi:MucR family transcriptional regulator, transcriptional regulator of exopolysaccharide biosynthesis
VHYELAEELRQNGGGRGQRHPQSMDPILNFTAAIVCAFVSKNSIDVRDVPILMTSVYNTAKNISEGPVSATGKAAVPVPAVPIGETVFDAYIVCLENGGRYRSLTRHLRAAYNMSPEEYRAKWNLPPDYPMAAPASTKVRSRIARDAGFGRYQGASEPPGADLNTIGSSMGQI